MACETLTAVEVGNNTSPNFTVRDLRQHSPETLRTLQALLASGACVKPDPNRPSFYELSSESDVFYIYVSPVDGTIELLATWAKYETAELLRRANSAA
jgi:hypothetical protein